MTLKFFVGPLSDPKSWIEFAIRLHISFPRQMQAISKTHTLVRPSKSHNMRGEMHVKKDSRKIVES